MDNFEVVIVGAGVLGLAAAYRLCESPKFKNKSVLLVDSEANFGTQTSSRNSEVIHAGIYYATDSLKAKHCVEGKHLLYEHLSKFQLPHKKLGKLIVAQKGEEEALSAIKEKALRNGVDDLTEIDKEQLKKIEPEVNGSAALLSPSTGIIDSHSYMQNLLHLAESRGVTFAPYTQIESVNSTTEGFSVNATLIHANKKESYQFRCSKFVNCAGLEAQKLAGKTEGVDPALIPQIHLCKGDYFSYVGISPFSHLIYPMPEANHTGLGIHSTLDIGGQLRFGPDTEYVNTQNYAIDAQKSVAFAEAISRYFPAISAQKLQPAYSGIRPKIAGPGEIAGDFEIQDRSIHGIEGLIQLFGMESPALTASLAIGNHITALLE
ncbi:MAG: FAD-dependent oxidoreductase [Pseudomonadales bacterium]|nr:FAD-dependent oxidoreductase [Pseudomonadales bacterium]